VRQPRVAPRDRAEQALARQDGQVDVAGLPALSADGTRVAVPEWCNGGQGPPCLAIKVFSVDGKVQERIETFACASSKVCALHNGKVRERVEVAQRAASEAQIRRVNRLLAAGRFAPMTSIELPFSAGDLNLMTLQVSDVVIHYGAGSLDVARDDHFLARLDLEPTGECTKALWIRSLFLDDKTHTVAAEFEYDDEMGCSDRPAGWRVLRFP
jgi:hypothetical protein